MKQRLKQELMLFARVFVKQVWFLFFRSYSPPKWLMRKMGATPLEIHSDAEREKMWKPYYDPIGKKWYKTLWQYVVKHSDNTCYLCEKVIKEEDVIEVDHRTSLFNFGASIPANLAVTHKACNRLKGWRNEAEYRKQFLLTS